MLFSFIHLFCHVFQIGHVARTNFNVTMVYVSMREMYVITGMIAMTRVTRKYVVSIIFPS